MSDGQSFEEKMAHNLAQSAKPIPKPEPVKFHTNESVVSDLMNKIGAFYGTDATTISKLFTSIVGKDKKDTKRIDFAAKRLGEVLEEIGNKKDPNDKRVFCKDCNSLGDDQSCACAKAGSKGANLSRYRPAPYVPRTCHDFFPAVYLATLPRPPGKIIAMAKDPVNSKEYGFHPADERWVRETLSEKSQNDEVNAAVFKQYQAYFRSMYEHPDCPNLGKDGFARRMANIWLRHEIDNMDMVAKMKAIGGVQEPVQSSSPSL